MWKDFKKFVARGNVFDLAVGIVLGAGFGTVVNSFVKDILTPPIGLLTRGIDFTELFLNLGPGDYETLAAAQEAGAPTLNYGVFLNNVISFLIVAFAVFLLVRGYNRIRVQEQEAPPPPSEKDCPHCRMPVPLAATRCPHCTSSLETPA
jgi:large conductance mechanosensitive channel